MQKVRGLLAFDLKLIFCVIEGEFGIFRYAIRKVLTRKFNKQRLGSSVPTAPINQCARKRLRGTLLKHD